MRRPDLIIGSPPQTLRWHLFRWRGVQVSLHRWLLSDSDRALHDHSADNISILLTGRYREYIQERVSEWAQKWCDVRTPLDAVKLEDGWHRRSNTVKVRLPFIPYFRKAETPHRVELHKGPVWTLWIRFPPRREWGFLCPKRWIHWKDYVAERDYSSPGSTSTVGSGCG